VHVACMHSILAGVPFATDRSTDPDAHSIWLQPSAEGGKTS